VSLTLLFFVAPASAVPELEAAQLLADRLGDLILASDG
jgi:hypothetical protein